MSPRVTMQKYSASQNTFRFIRSLTKAKAFEASGIKQKGFKPTLKPFCYLSAGKKVQISNDFAKDLGEILDFIDRFRPEIDSIGKEPEISEK